MLYKKVAEDVKEIESDEENERVKAELELERLRTEIAELKKEAERPHVSMQAILATVPKLDVAVEFHRMPHIDTEDKSGTKVISEPVRVIMKEDEILFTYPPKKPGIVEPIPAAIMKGIALNERHINYGIVLWNNSNDGGETKEEATIRGLVKFLDYVDELEMQINQRHSEIQEARSDRSVPNEALTRTRYPHTTRMLGLKKMAEAKLQTLREEKGMI